MRSARSQSGTSPGSCGSFMRRASHICGRHRKTPEKNSLPIVATYAMLTDMSTTGEALIGATEAAEILSVSKDTLIRMIARGDLAAVHKLPAQNGAYLLRRAEGMEFAARRPEAASPCPRSTSCPF